MTGTGVDLGPASSATDGGPGTTDAGVGLSSASGDVVVTLRAGALEVDVVPGLAMVGTSIRFEGREHVVLRHDLAGYRAGHTTGVPLLHPWANRLPGDRVAIPGTDVVLELDGDSHVGRDPAGLPIHGSCTAAPGFELAWLEVEPDGDGAVLEAVLPFDRYPDLLASFPFPHHVRVRWEALAPGHPQGGTTPQVCLTTTVVATGDVPVPVAFGWHPYLCLPGVPRHQWRLVLPEREHLLVDERLIPTGEEEYEPAEADPLGARTFDDGYRLGTERRLGLMSGERFVSLAFDDGYGYAQVYAPAGEDLVALEPMTAPTAGLATGEHPWAQPGRSFSASVTITCG